MKKIVAILGGISLMFMISSLAYARRQYRDYWNNAYKHYDKLWVDTDGDGVINYYDYNDRDKNIWSPYQKRSTKYRSRKRTYYYRSK